MQDNIALVTGGMGGIGTVIAQQLADAGATVAVTYNKGGDHALADAWCAEQMEKGYEFSAFYADLTDFSAAQNLVDGVVDKYSRIDILVNNAGITADSSLAKMELSQWQKVIDADLNSIFNVTRNVVKAMLAHKYGRIINVSSINGQKGQFGQTNYCAAKAGMHGFTKALAYEVARKGITVNTISPGYVQTSMVEKIPQNILEDIIKQIPVGRLASPLEVARAVAFLAAKSSGYITGANLAINGGQHMF